MSRAGGQISGASRIGARTVYVAAQPQTLRRTFRWQRLRHLDELWVVTPTAGGPNGWLTLGQRMRLARGPDQPGRIRACAAQGLIEAAPLDPLAIAGLAASLLADRSQQAQLREHVRQAGRTNGLLESVRCLEQLVSDRA